MYKRERERQRDREREREGERERKKYLVEVDDGLPELVLLLVEVSHTDLTEVTGVVFVDVGSVVVLTTGHTTTTGMLAVLSDTTVTGRDVATAVEIVSILLLSMCFKYQINQLSPKSPRLIPPMPLSFLLRSVDRSIAVPFSRSLLRILC